MASIREVARLAKVSPSTVSRALNGSGYVAEETKDQIRRAVSELDYVPNQWIRNLYRKKTGIIGVLTPELIHPYFSTLWSYLEKYLHVHGYNMMLCNTAGNQNIEREYLDTLERNLFDGMVIGTAFLPDEYYTKLDKPMVSMDRIIEGIPLVTSCHAEGGKIAAAQFLNKECKKVLCFGNLADINGTNISSALTHIKIREILLANGTKVVYEDFPWEDAIHYSAAMRRAKSILGQYPDLDGLIANDLCAAAFLKAAKEMNIKVPEKLKIISYDGTFLTDFNYIQVASIVQDEEAIAKAAVDVLLRQINKQPLASDRIYIPVYYKEGETI